MSTNSLAKWLDFYDKNKLAGSTAGGDYMRTWYGAQSGEQRPGLLWAQQMANQEGQGDRQMPDFFANQPGRMSGGGEDRQPAAYVQPQQFMPQPPPQTQYGLTPQGPSGQPLGQELNAWTGERPPMGGENQMRPDVLNYLSKLLGGRGKYGY